MWQNVRVEQWKCKHTHCRALNHALHAWRTWQWRCGVLVVPQVYWTRTRDGRLETCHGGSEFCMIGAPEARTACTTSNQHCSYSLSDKRDCSCTCCVVFAYLPFLEGLGGGSAVVSLLSTAVTASNLCCTVFQHTSCRISTVNDFHTHMAIIEFSLILTASLSTQEC